MESTTPGDFAVANELLGDAGRLNAAFERDGYLFFRQALDPGRVGAVKRDFLRVLADQGVVPPGADEPTYTGAGFGTIDDAALYDVPSYVELVESDAMRALLEQVFGGPVFVYRCTNVRYALPEDEAHVTPPHQDHFFIRANRDFRTVWVPLMAIDRHVGGLTVAAGSHRHGLREHRELDGVYSYQMKGRKQRGVAADDVTGPWRTADYRPGDVLVFHSLAIHRALPNRSNLIRLSLDARAQPAATPRTWQAETTLPEQRRYRQKVQCLAAAEGASEQQFEALVIEMMKRGTAPERSAVRTLLVELGGRQPERQAP